MHGGTFLEWTLHYLAGHTHIHSGMYDTQPFKKRLVSDSPVTKVNAHNHVRNHPIGYNQYKVTKEKLLSIDTDGFHTIYATFLKDDTTNDYDKIWNAVHTNNDKTIVLMLSDISKHYLFLDSALTRDSGSPPLFELENEQWRENGLTNRWDYREMLALNKRPFCGLGHSLDLSKSHISINPIDLFNTFDLTVETLFGQLALEIDQSRMSQWKSVYNQWKQVHYDRMQWIWYFDQIIEYIINGHSMDLTRFKLDLFQEATIQHVLIYKHNLNLKTWNLEKFPLNTKDITALLEPNTHQLEPYYENRK